MGLQALWRNVGISEERPSERDRRSSFRFAVFRRQTYNLNMGRLISLLFACALAVQSQPMQVVSSAFGRGITISERDLAGTLIFTLNNGLPSRVRMYELEVWATYEHGPARRLCVLKNSDADVLPQAVVQLPAACRLQADPAQERPASHATRIVAVELANGWKWHAPRTYRVVRYRSTFLRQAVLKWCYRKVAVRIGTVAPVFRFYRLNEVALPSVAATDASHSGIYRSVATARSAAHYALEVSCFQVATISQ
jgi:hypothetical protein